MYVHTVRLLLVNRVVVVGFRCMVWSRGSRRVDRHRNVYAGERRRTNRPRSVGRSPAVFPLAT